MKITTNHIMDNKSYNTFSMAYDNLEEIKDFLNSNTCAINDSYELMGNVDEAITKAQEQIGEALEVLQINAKK